MPHRIVVRVKYVKPMEKILTHSKYYLGGGYYYDYCCYYYY